MDEKSRYQGNHSLVQKKPFNSKDSTGTWYWTHDCFSVGEQIKSCIQKQDWGFDQQDIEKKVNQASYYPLQTFLPTQTRYSSASAKKARGSKKNCIQTRYWPIVTNNPQISQKKRIDSKTNQLQETALSEWESYETI